MKVPLKRVLDLVSRCRLSPINQIGYMRTAVLVGSWQLTSEAMTEARSLSGTWFPKSPSRNKSGWNSPNNIQQPLAM